MLAGYFMQVAHLEKTGHYLTVKDNQVCKTISFILLFFSHLCCWFQDMLYQGLCVANKNEI